MNAIAFPINVDGSQALAPTQEAMQGICLSPHCREWPLVIHIYIYGTPCMEIKAKSIYNLYVYNIILYPQTQVRKKLRKSWWGTRHQAFRTSLFPPRLLEELGCPDTPFPSLEKLPKSIPFCWAPGPSSDLVVELSSVELPLFWSSASPVLLYGET